MDDLSDKRSSRPDKKTFRSRFKSVFGKSKDKESKAVHSTSDGRNDASKNSRPKIMETSEHSQHQLTTTTICASVKYAVSNSKVATSEEISAYSDADIATSTRSGEPVVTQASQMTSRSDVSQKATTAELLKPCLISELWNEAYESLRTKEEKLVKDYEAILSTNIETAFGLTSDILSPRARVTRRDQMERILKRKLAEMKENEWRLRFNGLDIAFKDLAEPVLGIVSAADQYVTNALSANPYASIAWAGVSLILPIFLNPSDQVASLANGLKTISDLIVQSSMREALYAHRYDSQSNSTDQKKFERVHIEYRGTLQEEYSLILKFQAMCVCYSSQGKASRLGSDLVKRDNWDSALQEIVKQDEAFCKVYDILKDTIQQEEYDALSERYEESSKTMATIAGDMSALNRAIESAQSDQRRRELLKWLSVIDPSENYRNALGKREVDTTGYWLTRNHEGYGGWKEAPNSFLWLHGKAGSGKSVLCSSIIKGLENSYDLDPKVAIAYFYFSFNDKKKQNTDELLCSLIRQLWCKRPDKPPIVQNLDQCEKKNHRPDLETLKQTLAAMICGFSRVYIIIDALDECPNEDGLRERLLKTLCGLHKANHSNFHLLCTSRSESDIEVALRPLMSSQAAIGIDLDSSYCNDLVREDIRLHLDEVFADSKYNSWPPEIKVEAKGVLIKKAEGMFQYVTCQLDVLGRLRNLEAIRQALEGLPIGLDATYDRMLGNVRPENRKQVARILKWLCFSARPLYLDELAEIFILDPESDVPFDQEQRLFDSEDVLIYLPNMVTKIPIEDGYEIRLAHFSIKEYLLSTRTTRTEGPAREFFITETNAHLQIAKSSLAYHLHLSENILLTREVFEQFKLWDYVLYYYDEHLDKVPRQLWPSSLRSWVAQIFTLGARSLLNLVRKINPDDDMLSDYELDFDYLASPLYYAAGRWSLLVIEELLGRGDAINEVLETSEYGTALQAAAAVNSSQDIIQLLLNKGASINLQGGRYGTALQTAAVNNSQEIIQLLLDKGADLLLDKGADVNLQGGYYGNALQAAAAKNAFSIAELLFSRGAKIDPPGPEWEELLLRIRDRDGDEPVARLCKFQENPEGFLA
ncbi:hypothetical protein BDZ45DRAFT_802669 [Acephala macrosclerotiorum]|nr:hypothetical protein BDZ45DRAFT_802669 [Acephala macrosclerotiorum]